MTLDNLYLESGPMKKRTLVHALDRLGLNWFGATTDAALEKSRAEIQFYRDWLRAHGEAIEADAIEWRVAEHITKGDFLGHGSASFLFAPDRLPLTPKELEKHLRHLAWQRAGLLELTLPLSGKARTRKSTGKRSIQEILEHIQEAERAYPRPMPRLPKTRDIYEKMEVTRADVIARLNEMAANDTGEIVMHGSSPSTARRVLRHVLEHEWEHLQEIRSRLEM